MTADPRVDRWLEGDRPWRAEIRALRTILLDEGLEERLRWRKPCYAVPGGGNVAIIAAMKEAVGLSFFKGVLLDDPRGLLVPVGPNSRSAMWARFRGLDEIEAAEAPLRALIRQAARNEAEGRRPEMPPDDFDLPDELTETLAADDDYAAAWHDLTPGRRRGWALHFAGAKQKTTRQRRVERAREAILSGKGWAER